MRKYILFLLITTSINSYAKINYANEFNFKIIKTKHDHKNLAGVYQLYADGKTYNMEIFVRCNKLKAKIKFGNKKISSKFLFKKNVITITLHKEDVYVKLVGKVLNSAGAMAGVSIDSNGKQSEWSAARLIKDTRSNVKTSKKVAN
jgi:hypothetical protein